MRDDRFTSLEPKTPVADGLYHFVIVTLDAHAAGLALRQIAFALVFPRNQPLAGAAWKGSGERRHTHRLLGEAQRMCRQGYRTLLEKG